MTSKTFPGGEAPRARIEGGYEPITVTQLAMAWWAYRSGLIRKLDLRAWFGCWELEIRRRLSEGRYQPSLAELKRLLGSASGRGQGGLRGSLRRLRSLGLLRSCTKEGISFAESPDELRVEDLGGLWEMLGQLSSPGRRVPVPRRILRRLAGGLSKARTATVLAHLMRCLFYRKGEGINPVGCCKASWVAEVFGITERSVYDARRYLVEDLGWLRARDCSQHVLNRDGLWVSIDLDWGSSEVGQGRERPEAPTVEPVDPAPVESEPDVSESSPPPADSAGHFSGPKENKKPLRDHTNQKPASRGPAGIRISKSKEQSPRLSDVLPEDLRDIDRLLELFGQAVDRGLVTSSEADRLKFVAAAIHAQAVGSEPCRLFAWLINQRRFEVITQADEDEAHARLKRHQQTRYAVPAAPSPRPPALSNDALIVREIRAVLRARGIHVDPYAAARGSLPDWSRERWDRAVEELEGRRQPVSGFSALEAIVPGLGAAGSGVATATMEEAAARRSRC